MWQWLTYVQLYMQIRYLWAQTVSRMLSNISVRCNWLQKLENFRRNNFGCVSDSVIIENCTYLMRIHTISLSPITCRLVIIRTMSAKPFRRPIYNSALSRYLTNKKKFLKCLWHIGNFPLGHGYRFRVIIDTQETVSAMRWHRGNLFLSKSRRNLKEQSKL
jgi:hypothetical protein